MRDRIPPHSLEAEQNVLGAMMVDASLADRISSIVAKDDFYAHVHGTIFAALQKLHDANQPTDFLAVATELSAQKRLETCGGIAYLRGLYDTVQSAATADYYATLVSEKATLRRLIAASGKISDAAYAGESDVAEAVAESEKAMRDAITRSVGSDAGENIGQAVSRVFKATVDASDAVKRTGITSPWPTFDRATGLTFGGEMVVWAAAPGVGKSIALQQLAEHVARIHGSVAFFALEMGINATARRMLAKRMGISSRRLRLGDLRGGEWDRVGDALDAWQAQPITLFDRVPRRSVSDVRRCLRRLSSESPVVASVIDHANFLADATTQSRTSKHERLDTVYQGLLEIAGEFDCVMHVVQHFSREGATGEPGLQHLRDGGNLEGHANVVVFPMRRNMATEPERGEFIIAKNRESELCRIPMRFDGFRQEWVDEEGGQQMLVAAS